MDLRENLGALDRRLLILSDWIERDRREPDKVLMYAQQLRADILREAAKRYGH